VGVGAGVTPPNAGLCAVRIAVALLALLSTEVLHSTPLSPAHSAASGPAKVERLLAAMTLEEKIAFIHGATEEASTYQGQAGYLPGTTPGDSVAAARRWAARRADPRGVDRASIDHGAGGDLQP